MKSETRGFLNSYKQTNANVCSLWLETSETSQLLHRHSLIFAIYSFIMAHTSLVCSLVEPILTKNECLYFHIKFFFFFCEIADDGEEEKVSQQVRYSLWERSQWFTWPFTYFMRVCCAWALQLNGWIRNALQ